MNFLEAVKAMKEGKKVKYNEASYWIDKDGWINRKYIGETKRTIMPHFDNNIWQVIEEKKTLSDKRNLELHGEVYSEENVKQAIKEFLFKLWLSDKLGIKSQAELEILAKEIFGERLI